jgi:transcriptional regulator with XRE-family HTH domain
MRITMPATAPPMPEAASGALRALGEQLRGQRKALRISAVATAGAAGLSRVTLHRIERGEASVTIGAYFNVAAALGLNISLTAPVPAKAASAPSTALQNPLPEIIRLADYPQLQSLAWQLPGALKLTQREALGLYERNWRQVDTAQMGTQERALVTQLVQERGKGVLLV